MQTHFVPTASLPFRTDPRRSLGRFAAVGLVLGSVLLPTSISWGQRAERVVERVRTPAVAESANPFVEIKESPIEDVRYPVRTPDRRIVTRRQPIVYSGDRSPRFDEARDVPAPATEARYFERDPRGSSASNNERTTYVTRGGRVADEEFSDRGPFNYNRPRIRNVGRDRELSDERYFDRVEYPDRFKGNIAPDYVEESPYIPDYRPEYRETEWRRAGTAPGSEDPTDQLRREEEPLRFRGGGRLGRGPTGISDDEFMGAGGRDTAGRRRGVSGQSGAFGGRDRGAVVGARGGIGYAPGDYGVRELYDVPLGELPEPLPPVVERVVPLAPPATRLERVPRR